MLQTLVHGTNIIVKITMDWDKYSTRDFGMERPLMKPRGIVSVEFCHCVKQ